MQALRRSGLQRPRRREPYDVTAWEVSWVEVDGRGVIPPDDVRSLSQSSRCDQISLIQSLISHVSTTRCRTRSPSFTHSAVPSGPTGKGHHRTNKTRSNRLLSVSPAYHSPCSRRRTDMHPPALFPCCDVRSSDR